MSSIKPDGEPKIFYPAPLDPDRGTIVPDSTANYDLIIDVPILVVGGGPVGMLQALMLARLHKVRTLLVERESRTTTYPKMEYTNGRSMEIYRKIGFSEEFRALGNRYVPDDVPNDELIVTSMIGESAHLVNNWPKPSFEEIRRVSREKNDGSRYLEPHLRCHQIPMEAWLKIVVEREKDMVESHWGWQFLGLREEEDSVVSEIRTRDGRTVKVKSQYVIGCDGGGSWVRKSVGLESQRKYLNLMVSFVHFTSKKLREMINFPQFWHANIIGGGVLVSQNEADLFTIHLTVPPGMDASGMTPDQVLATGLGGCAGPTSVEIDEVLAKGLWAVDVAVANNFRSDKGRVFLAGDAAHQLSPVGGHGLNTGIADAFDLAWKLSARLSGWAGDDLLESYDSERRKIAYKNLGHVQEALATVLMPVLFQPLQTHGPHLLASNTPEGQKARDEITESSHHGSWVHNQNGNILGYQYTESKNVILDQELTEKPTSTSTEYVPTTWPGSRAPHVFMRDPKQSTLDCFKADALNLVNFLADQNPSQAFEAVANELNIPLHVLNWQDEDLVRKVYERDLVLVRPDMHVAWRMGDKSDAPLDVDQVRAVLAKVVGK